MVYVGDRMRRKGQLNGKSSNLNHVILSKIYPSVEKPEDVSSRDILLVMDCDHLVQPAFFQKCCAVMLDQDTAVWLTPAPHALFLQRWALISSLLSDGNPHCNNSVSHSALGGMRYAVVSRLLVRMQVCLVPQSFHNAIRPGVPPCTSAGFW